MRDNDTIILENLYISIIEEDAASSKAQALNFFVQNEVGREVFKYKNKPENKEVIEKAKRKWNPSVESLADHIILQYNEKDKNLSDIIPLAKFLLDTNFDLLEKEYSNYVRIPSLFNQKTIQKAPNFAKWTEEIHAKQAEGKEKKESEVLGTDQDPNKVYEDDGVIVFLATDVNDPNKSITNCRKYGQGSTMCICGNSAKHYYNHYRWEDKLTTYFAYLKDKKTYVLIDAAEDGHYQYNNIHDNTDREAPPKVIVSIYPQLQTAFEKGVIKAIPLTPKEKDFYERFYNATSIFQFDNLDDMITYLTFHDVGTSQWYGFNLNPERSAMLEPILTIAVESTETPIPEDILSRFPKIRARYWQKVNQNVEREISEWDEDDKIDFNNDEWKVLANMDVPDSFIDTLSQDASSSKNYAVACLKAGKSPDFLPRSIVDAITRHASLAQVYAQELDAHNYPVEPYILEAISRTSFSALSYIKWLLEEKKQTLKDIPEVLWRQLIANGNYANSAIRVVLKISPDNVDSPLVKKLWYAMCGLITIQEMIHEYMNHLKIVPNSIPDYVWEIWKTNSDHVGKSLDAQLLYDILNKNKEFPKKLLFYILRDPEASLNICKYYITRDKNPHNTPEEYIDGAIRKPIYASILAQKYMGRNVSLSEIPKKILKSIAVDLTASNNFISELSDKEDIEELPEELIQTPSAAIRVIRKCFDFGLDIPEKCYGLCAKDMVKLGGLCGILTKRDTEPSDPRMLKILKTLGTDSFKGGAHDTFLMSMFEVIQNPSIELPPEELKSLRTPEQVRSFTKHWQMFSLKDNDTKAFLDYFGAIDVAESLSFGAYFYR